MKKACQITKIVSHKTDRLRYLLNSVQAPKYAHCVTAFHLNLIVQGNFQPLITLTLYRIIFYLSTNSAKKFCLFISFF